MPRFPNREQSGRELTGQLSKFQNQQGLVMPVLNGGVPTAILVSSDAFVQPVPDSSAVRLDE